MSKFVSNLYTETTETFDVFDGQALSLPTIEIDGILLTMQDRHAFDPDKYQYLKRSRYCVVVINFQSRYLADPGVYLNCSPFYANHDVARPI